jgi:hypothetical protein
MTDTYIINDIVVPFLKGEKLTRTKLWLGHLIDETNNNVISEFKKYDDEHFKNQILDSLLLTAHRQKRYKEEYDAWRNTLNISDNLLHFLEFLSQKGYYRLRYLLKAAASTSPKTNYLEYFFSGAILSCIGAGIYFAYCPGSWEQMISFLQTSGPQIALWLLNYILIPVNLAFIILAYQTIKYFADCYFILDNRCTTTEHKLTTLIKTTTTAALVIAGQTLNCLNFGIATGIGNYLFIAAAIIDLVWSGLQIYQLKKPSLPDNPTLEEQIFFKEQEIYYQRKKDQFKLEICASVLITVASIGSIVLASQFTFIPILSIVFQFLVSITKNYYYNKLEYQSTEKLQNDIHQLHETQPTMTQRLKQIIQDNESTAESKLSRLVEILETEEHESLANFRHSSSQLLTLSEIPQAEEDESQTVLPEIGAISQLSLFSENHLPDSHEQVASEAPSSSA